MALTPGGTPYVESSDLVADYPTVSLALAEHIDDLPAKILQVVRATDATDRSTTSTSFTNANISVTITPQKSTSAILLIWNFEVIIATSPNYIATQITDNSNNPISGAEELFSRTAQANGGYGQTLFGYDTPGTTSATIYKGRFRSTSGTVTLKNTEITGQLYAIEVSA
jgi:hypothetical protein